MFWRGIGEVSLGLRLLYVSLQCLVIGEESQKLVLKPGYRPWCLPYEVSIILVIRPSRGIRGWESNILARCVSSG